MQVNNTVSTNFGMALRIKNPQQTAKALKELPLPVVEKYADAADKLKGTTFYHLQVDSDLKPVILGKQGSYWGPIVSEKAVIRKVNDDLFDKSKELKISRDYVGNDGFVHHKVDKNADVSSLTDIVLALDKAAVEHSDRVAREAMAQAAEKAARKAAYQAEKQAVKNTVDKLVNRFSINA